MNKKYCSLGLMSGTSLDGIDASIIISDGEDNLKIIDNIYRKYTNIFQNKLGEFIEKINDLSDLDKNIAKYREIQKEITLEHFNISNEIIKKNQNYNVDFVGFHGQTVIHKPLKGYSVQIGDPNLLSKLLKKKIYFNFRKNDIKNGGQGAPLTPIYHELISKISKIDKPVIFLNIGGISNLTYIEKNKDIISYDVGPGNCLINKWINANNKGNYDKDGLYAEIGKVDKNILNSIMDQELNILSDKRSLDVKDFDINFLKGLNLENGAATITEFTAQVISNKINSLNKKNCKIIVCGGGRKNKYLIRLISKLTVQNIINVDKLGFDGNYIESQAFAYLAIRSHLLKFISFPSTTGVKSPVIGGELFNSF